MIHKTLMTYIELIAVLLIRILTLSDPVFLGHLDLDPNPGKYQIQIRIVKNTVLSK